jgi:hypothetical protein
MDGRPLLLTIEARAALFPAAMPGVLANYSFANNAAVER